ncbi:MAG: hypothetical protein ACREL5_13745 [Gemmatimonadales bacterium]
MKAVDVAAAIALSVAATRAAAQARIPTIVLDHGATEFPESFSGVARVVELRDRRLVVLDNTEKELRLVDIAHGTMTPISRHGGGPLEYQAPGILLTGAADTVAYYDATQQRILLISPSGTPLQVISLGTANVVFAVLSGMQPSAVDARGRIYGQTAGMSMSGMGRSGSPPGMAFADTVEIQLLDRQKVTGTTLTRIRNPIAQVAPKIAMGPDGITISMTAPGFFPVDAWAVLPDGRLAVLRDGVYQVHFLAPGRPETVGPVIPYTPIPVTDAERRTLLDSLRAQLDSQMAKTRAAMSRGGGATNVPKIDARVIEPTKWASTKPAYTALSSAPDGHLWVTVSQPAASRSMLFDVLDGRGAMVAHVQLADGELPVGFGRGTVYTIRIDDDDLQYLRRYQLPRLP